MIDLIGDIHGHADKLKALLRKLGYSMKKGSFSHPSRKVLFIGDYLDRGPKIMETIDIVRRMTLEGNAIALMGNHEYNAISFHTESKEGGHIRKHSIKNVMQHVETLKQYLHSQREYEEVIQWLKTLPLFYESEAFNAVHACWDHESVDYLKSVLPDGRLTDELLHQTIHKDSPLTQAIDDTLKGKEISMPGGLYFTDKDGNHRHRIRIKWWEDPSTATYKSISVIPIHTLPEEKFDLSLIRSTRYYGEQEKPVFFGHYWFGGTPALCRENACCLDYSVARGGNLVAYRYDGEERLENGKLLYV